MGPAAAGAVRSAVLRWWAVVLAVGTVVATMIEPVPDGPQAVERTPVLIGVIGDVTLVLLFVAFEVLPILRTRDNWTISALRRLWY
ncbi:hypothetical protein FsymDg_1725 [Candidatus Protofrankia datiscae]|uniref:Uncharacterized protein n=1 Tax=Candidatus Protofrankia datiscae TaxID=2716812 RepID=F8B5K5_9ACTN|nr:hypothetical protein [Candidatus Protofrankia datiscae]AEH09175.1 hypothetical protein FsymDg_1725 [Candidatus Protofrankia datiscae]